MRRPRKAVMAEFVLGATVAVVTALVLVAPFGDAAALELLGRTAQITSISSSS